MSAKIKSVTISYLKLIAFNPKIKILKFQLHLFLGSILANISYVLDHNILKKGKDTSIGDTLTSEMLLWADKAQLSTDVYTAVKSPNEHAPTVEWCSTYLPTYLPTIHPSMYLFYKKSLRMKKRKLTGQDFET